MNKSTTLNSAKDSTQGSNSNFLTTDTNEASMVATRTTNYDTVGSRKRRRRNGKSPKLVGEDDAQITKPSSSVKTETPMLSGSVAKSQDEAVASSEPGSLHYTIVEKYNSDLFEEAPENSVLVQACNCRGSWGAGIAKAFAQKFPQAFVVYRKHCDNFRRNQSQLRGTSLLIPPVDSVDKPAWIACLFTSVGFGKTLDSTEDVLAATQSAMRHLMVAYKDVQQKQTIGDVYMCKINSGLFKVPWYRTRELLEKPDNYVPKSPTTIHLIAMGPEEPGDKRI